MLRLTHPPSGPHTFFTPMAETGSLPGYGAGRDGGCREQACAGQSAAKTLSRMSRPSASRWSGMTSGGRKRSTLP